MSAPSLLVLTHHYRPEPNFITAEVAERLATRMPVTVVTAHPHYPLGRFYEGTRWWRPRRSVEHGVTVWRVPMFPDHSRSLLRRFISYLSFALTAAVVAPFVVGRPTAVWVYQGPFTTSVAALWFRFAYRCRLVYTCADLWPESFLASNVLRAGLLIRMSMAYRRWMNRHAHLIICSTKGTAEQFEREGIPVERLRHIPVWVDAKATLEVPAGEDSNVIVYAGNIGPAQHLEVVIRGAAQLQAAGIDVNFDLFGSGSDERRLRDLASSLGAQNVTFRGRVSADDAFAASSAALGQIVSLRPSKMFRFTVPSKISFALGAAAPILHAVDGEAREILQASGGGIAYDCDDTDSFVHAVKSLLSLSTAEREAMSRSLRSKYLTELQPSFLLSQYESILSSVDK